VQVAFKCFYTAVHNKELYPTFTRASGRAGSRYANIFKALSDKFGFRKFYLFVNYRHQPAMEMSGYIAKALASATDVEKETADVIDVGATLEKIKEEGSERGAYGLHYIVFLSRVSTLTILI